MPATTLIERLEAERIAYELLPHRHTETATAEARALGLAADETAKTVVLRCADELVRAVVPASARVDLGKAQRVLGFAPKYSTKEAMVRNYRWYVEHLDQFEGTAGVSHRVPWKQGILGLAKIVF